MNQNPHMQVKFTL